MDVAGKKSWILEIRRCANYNLSDVSCARCYAYDYENKSNDKNLCPADDPGGAACVCVPRSGNVEYKELTIRRGIAPLEVEVQATVGVFCCLRSRCC